MSDELDGDGIGGAVLEILTGTAFRLLVSHTRKAVSYTHLTLPTTRGV